MGMSAILKSRKRDKTDLQKIWAELYYRSEVSRGGGDAGSMARGISIGFFVSVARVATTEIVVNAGGGITKAMAVMAGLVVSWQQDMEQFVMLAMSWPQSSWEAVGAGLVL